MNETIILCAAAFVTSLLTFFSGFGLGTILTPVFAIFFPVEVAVALTGVVHFLNNLFKLALVGRKADFRIALRFGIPAFFSALAGAYVLLQLTDLEPIHTYVFQGKEYAISPVKLIIAVLLIFFALMEAIPSLRNFRIGKGNLVLGGILSGFFGGLSGNQGAFRSAFLLRTNLSKEAFVATGIVIACMIDFSRLGVYMTRFFKSGLQENITLVIAATLSAFLGAYLGSKVLTKVTFAAVRIIVTIMLVVLSVLLGLGIV